MKKLTKLLLINWHYIQYQVIDFENINFLTGKNGAGKSTIIDALQLVLLGDTRGYFFNKSASDKSDRSLKGYLFGETSDDGEGGFRYLREGYDFSSYVVAEFWDTVKKEPFSVGVVFDLYSDGDEKHEFFILRDGLPENHFFNADQTTMSRKEIKYFLKNNLGQKVDFYPSNKSYQDAFRGVMGGIHEKFFSLFKKSVQFTPISDIEQFISEFICDVNSRVDIQDMQDNIRHYKNMEFEAEKVRRRIEDLEHIGTAYQHYRVEEDRLIEQQYLIHRSRLQAARDQLQRAEKQVGTYQQDLVRLEEEFVGKTAQKDELEERREKLVVEKHHSDQWKKLEQLQREKQELEGRQSAMDKTKSDLKKSFGSYGLRWREKVGAFVQNQHLEKSSEQNELLARLTGEANWMAEMQDADLNQVAEERLMVLSADMKEYQEMANKEFYDVTTVESNLQQQRNQLQEEILDLEKGIKPYDPKLMELKREIEEQLSTEVHLLCDIIDLKDETWRDAIEGYLHYQKFYLIIAPEHFKAALRIYDRLKFDRKFYNYGLVDVGKIMANNYQVMPGSLAEEVVTDNPYARAYANYLLGQVVKCEELDELNQYRTAITPTGMLYKNYTGRQLNPSRWKNPYIGQASLEKQLESKRQELAEVEGQVVFYEKLVQELDQLRKIEGLTTDHIKNILQKVASIQGYDQVVAELQKVISEIGSIDMSYLEKIDQQLEQVKKQLTILEKELRELNTKWDRTKDALSDLQNLRIPALRKEQADRSAFMEEKYAPEFAEEIGEPKFEKELATKGTPEKIISDFEPALSRTESQRQKRWEHLVSLRSDFNRDYQDSIDVTRTSNEPYERQLQEARDTALTKYEEEIRDAIAKAQDQFREDFISKLKQNIDMVKDQIKEMNDALKEVKFGKDNYRFEARPNPLYRKFYDMIMDPMLMEGYNLFSTSFQGKHQEAIEELFNHIVDVGRQDLTADEQTQLEQNIEKYTDYRTYLSFDLIVTNDQGDSSRLSKVLNKKSGGETQTPFYIAVLASFVQRYRIGRRDSNTLRLVAFDEAFNKMDHERIQKSLELLQSLGLQAIISAPTEKIGDIAPYVDRTLTVHRVQNQTVVKPFDAKKEKIVELSV